MKSQIDNIVFKYLDNQGFFQFGKGNRIYFINSEGDEYGIIRYDKDDGWCYINNSLTVEISSFFSLEDSDSEQVIGRWVENTLQIRVTNAQHLHPILTTWLKIPN